MKNLKHVAKMQNTGAKVLVVFRTLPGESNYSLVLPVAQLPDSYHDSVMSLVESEEAQQSFEFGEIMFARMFPDGRPMLRAMQADGRLVKVATDAVIMTPTPQAQIPLSQLNVLIAEQKNCTVDELCTFVQGAPAAQRDSKVKIEDNAISEVPKAVVDPVKTFSNQPLTDLDIAKSLRSQADGLYKEAARLRKQADELDPPKKKVKTSETVDA
jgi:hypothetical protein